MILIIDNYDSFTYNLVQLVGLHTKDFQVVRNDRGEFVEFPVCFFKFMNIVSKQNIFFAQFVT